MTGRLVCVVCVVFVMAAAALQAQLPEAWQHWRFSSPIVVSDPAARGELVRVEVSADAAARARPDFADLRVIDDSGRELPYVLIARTGNRSLTRRDVPLLEPTAVPGEYRQVIADAGPEPAVHNSVHLRIEARQNLLGWVEVAVSADLGEWRVIRDSAPIYVLQAEGMGANTDVSYPDSASRYVRIRVQAGTDAYAISGAAIGYESATPAEYAPAQIPLRPEAGDEANSVWVSPEPAPATPVSRVSFRSGTEAFARRVTVEYQDDRGDWRVAARGEVLQAPGATGTRAWLTVDVPETTAARWRVTIHNGSDAPVPGLVPELLMTPRWVLFRAPVAGAAELLFGHPRADAPRYDLAQTAGTTAFEGAAIVQVGPRVENTGWVDSAPWSERNELVLWFALAAAVLVLGALAVRSLRD